VPVEINRHFFPKYKVSRDKLRLVNVRSLGAFFAVYDVEADLLAFRKGLKAVPSDSAEMNEYVLTLVRSNKTVALTVVKPLHCLLNFAT